MPRPRPAAAEDAVLGLGVAAAWVLAVQLLRAAELWHPRGVGSWWCAGLALAVPLALRRTAPRTALAVTLVGYGLAATALAPSGIVSVVHVLPVVLAAGLAARAGARAPLVVAGAVPVTVWLTVGAPAEVLARARQDPRLLVVDPSDLVLLVGLVVAATALGSAFGRLASTSAALAARHRELERLTGLQLREAVHAERARIARDLHDVVAHHVTAVVVRAQAADRVGGDDPEVYRDAVRWIAPTGREALAAMRSVVRVLREDDDGAPGDAAPTTLTALVDGVRRAGLVVDLDVPPRWSAPSPEVALAVVRTAQEALTNVVAHSAAGAARLRLLAGPGTLRLEVDDPGPARDRPVAGGGGFGLVGMRERAQRCGGDLVAGPTAAGGWSVRLEVPRGR